MTEAHKQKLKEAREKAKAEKDAKVVLLEQSLNEFKTSTDDKFNKIIGVLETMANKPTTPERNVMMATEGEKPVTAGSVSHTNSAEPVVHNLHAVSPAYQEIFEKYFDMADGFKAMLKGVNFKIEVPLHMSNAQQAHKDFYKIDIRHKVLDGHDIEGTMERYCKLVAHNLNYNRQIKLKI